MAAVSGAVASGGAGLVREGDDGASTGGGAAFPLSGGRYPPLPRMGADFAVCRTCAGPARLGCGECWSCLVVRLRLGRPTLRWPIPVTPICVATAGSGMHAALIAYKAAPTDEVRTSATRALGNLLGEWLAHHTGCMLGNDQSASLVPVPSSTGGRASWEGGHPIEAICRLALEGRQTSLALQSMLRAGEHPPTRLQPDAKGFEIAGGGDTRRAIGGRSVLVVDDLFASGSRAFSAAAALAAAGADVRGILVLARFVRPKHNAAAAAYWRASRPVASVDLARVCRRCIGLAPDPSLSRTTAASPAASACCSRHTVVLRLAA